VFFQELTIIRYIHSVHSLGPIAMLENIILVIIYLLFLFTSIFLYKQSFRIRKQWLYILVPVYFIVIWFCFELVNYIHIVLRENGFYLEFGHASIGLLLVMIYVYLTAIFLLILAMMKRAKCKELFNLYNGHQRGW
jgi:hypothetical protein